MNGKLEVFVMCNLGVAVGMKGYEQGAVEFAWGEDIGGEAF